MKTSWRCKIQSCFHALAVAGVLALASTVPSPAADISYVYDNLGRLLAVVDPASDTAVYSYDAVGNLTGITRQASSTLAIFQFTPSSGPVGTPVTIYGTGFSATPASNTVKFNGTTATVVTASTTVLTTTVPAGATTGAISVTVSGTTATSAASFTVGTGSVPTISDFSPTVGVAGTSVSITGTNFNAIASNNKVRFNYAVTAPSAVTSTNMTAAVPATATSGHISVSTPYGTATSTGDFFAPPAPYTAANVGPTGRFTVGQSTTATISAANKIGLILFDGTASQRVSLKVSSVTIPLVTVSILNTNGTTMRSATVSSGATGFLDVITLTQPATYTILVAPSSGTYTGSVTLTLYNVPADVTGTITPGGSAVPVTLSTPGQNASLTFSGTASQRVSFAMSGSTFGYFVGVTIKNPDGTTLIAAASGSFSSTTGFLDVTTLPQTGTYTIVLDPYGSIVGTANFTLYNVPADVTGTITPGGSAVPVTISTPGQNASLTFSGTANQRVSFAMSGSTFGYFVGVTIKNPDGTTLIAAASGSFSSTTGFLDVTTLPQTGTYTIVLDPYGSIVGTANFTLYNVVDVTGTITPGGSAVPVTISTPGQNASLTFSGTANQQVTVHVTNNTTYCPTVKLLKPDASVLTSLMNCGASFNLSTQTLPTNGTYTVFIDPGQGYTGSITITVTSP